MSSPLKIAVVGAGSFVFGPSVLIQALVENKINNAELMLMCQREPSGNHLPRPVKWFRPQRWTLPAS